jgi:phospholipase/carboxylesterase
MSDLGFVHRFVPGSGTTLLLLHGTGATEEDLIPLGERLLPGASLLSPRGKVLENGMPRFFRRLAEGVFDLADLDRRTHELAEFIEAAKARYAIAGKIVAVGYSNGANIASSLMLRRPGLLAGGALLRGMVPFEPEAPPSLAGTDVLLANGKRDPIVPLDHVRRLTEIFEAAGASVTTHWHEGGHELWQGDVAAAQRWLSRYAS